MLGSRVRAPGGAQRQFRNELLLCFIRYLPHFHRKTVADTHFEGGTCHGFPAISCLMFSWLWVSGCGVFGGGVPVMLVMIVRAVSKYCRFVTQLIQKSPLLPQNSISCCQFVAFLSAAQRRLPSSQKKRPFLLRESPFSCIYPCFFPVLDNPCRKYP